MPPKKQIVNWTYNGNPVLEVFDMPEGAIGFIYKVTNLSNGRYYFGRKTCISKCKKKLTEKEKSLPENFRKTWKIIDKESSWKNYTGSNMTLNADIKSGHNYKKEIIHYCFSKAQLTFYETRAIACSDCMLTEDCYNDWFSSKVYKKHLMNNKQ